jgi:uncharacterized RDD family membrane protein YckC
MKCPSCGYLSLEDGIECKKCGTDMSAASVVDSMGTIDIEDFFDGGKQPADDGVREGAWKVEKEAGTAANGKEPAMEPDGTPPEPAPVTPPPATAPGAGDSFFDELTKEATASVAAPKVEPSFDAAAAEDPPTGEPSFDTGGASPEEEGQVPVEPVPVEPEPIEPVPMAEEEAHMEEVPPPVEEEPVKAVETPYSTSELIDADSFFEDFNIDFNASADMPAPAAPPVEATAETVHDIAPPVEPVAHEPPAVESLITTPFADSFDQEEEEPEQPAAAGGYWEEETAGFVWRAGAFLVDNLILGLILTVFIVGASLGMFIKGVSLGWLWGNLWVTDALLPFYILAGIVSAVYFTYFVWDGGQTPGKRIFSLKVITREGGDPGLSTALTRWMAYMISAVPLGAGFFWALFDREGLTWHDRLTGTTVIPEAD